MSSNKMEIMVKYLSLFAVVILVVVAYKIFNLNIKIFPNSIPDAIRDRHGGTYGAERIDKSMPEFDSIRQALLDNKVCLLNFNFGTWRAPRVLSVQFCDGLEIKSQIDIPGFPDSLRFAFMDVMGEMRMYGVTSQGPLERSEFIKRTSEVMETIKDLSEVRKKAEAEVENKKLRSQEKSQESQKVKDSYK